MLAIIIPYYKLTFFEATLQSLANQTNKRFKVYIGDDASLDNPSSLLKQFQGKFEFIYHRFESNFGSISLVQQWNRCIDMCADEEWIMILGDDDVLGNNFVDTFYNNLEEAQLHSSVIRFSTYKIDEEGKKISSVFMHPKIEKSTDFIFRNSRSSLSEYVFNKNQMLKIGFKELPLGWLSDVLAVLEFSNFKEVFSINEAKVYIRISNLSISGKNDNVNFKTMAAFDFYYYLVVKKRNYFTDLQYIELRNKLNKIYLNNKKEGVFFFKITKFYFFNFLIKEYFYFLKSIYFNVTKG